VRDASGMTQHSLPPQGAVFFTLRLAATGSTTLVDHIEKLRLAYAITTHDLPVHCHAMVVLPDHLHAIWSEVGPPRFAERWRRIKARFSQGTVAREGLWDADFLHLAIGSVEEMERRMTYCRMDPVKHGLAKRWEDWRYSSFTKVHAARPRQATMAFAGQEVAA
jgi:putative transposase